jgi:hypothetical protein
MISGKVVLEMKYDSVYRELVQAVESGRLVEPFTAASFRNACPGYPEGTYRAFVWKHSADVGSSALNRVAPGKYVLAHPIRPSLIGTRPVQPKRDDKKAKLSR